MKRPPSASALLAGVLALSLTPFVLLFESLPVRSVLLHGVALLGWLVLAARRLPWQASALFLVASVVNATGWGWGWLDDVWLYDELAHLLVSMALVFPLLCALVRRRLRSGALGTTSVLEALGLGLCGGLVWELFEWTSDHYVVPPGQMQLSDTLADLFADGGGSLLAHELARRLRVSSSARTGTATARSNGGVQSVA